MKKIFIMLIAVSLLLSIHCLALAENESTPSVSEAYDLIKQWEELYIKYYDGQLFYEYINNHGGIVKEKAVYYSRHTLSDNTVEYILFDGYLIVDPVGDKDDVTRLFESVFTKETAEKAINNSNLIFKDKKAFLPSVVSARHFSPVVEYLYYDVNSENAYEKVMIKNGCLPLEDRIRIQTLQNGEARIEFDYYIFEDDNAPEIKTSYITVVKTDDGYRVCELDDLYFKPDTFSDGGFRKNSLKNDNPQTSDAPIIAVCALAISAAAAVIFLKKRKH